MHRHKPEQAARVILMWLSICASLIPYKDRCTCGWEYTVLILGTRKVQQVSGQNCDFLLRLMGI